MKKILSLFLIFLFSFANASYAIVTDDFVEQTLDKNLKIKEYSPANIDDILITKDFVLRHKNEIYESSNSQISDNFVNTSLNKYKNEKLVAYIPANFQNLQKMSMQLKAKKYLTTRNKKVKEGTIIEFVLAKDIVYNEKLYKKGSTVKARVENISLNQAYGIPAQLEVGNFSINNEKLDTKLSVQGANRALWVVPVGYVGTLFLCLGLFVLPIRGGHAKLSPNKTYNLLVNVL